MSIPPYTSSSSSGFSIRHEAAKTSSTVCRSQCRRKCQKHPDSSAIFFCRSDKIWGVSIGLPEIVSQWLYARAFAFMLRPFALAPWIRKPRQPGKGTRFSPRRARRGYW